MLNSLAKEGPETVKSTISFILVAGNGAGSRSTHDLQPGNFSVTVFGLGLCSQFDIASRSAPLLVERCTSALEEKAFEDSTLDLYKVYHSSPPNEQTLELRQKLNEGKLHCPVVLLRSLLSSNYVCRCIFRCM